MDGESDNYLVRGRRFLSRRYFDQPHLYYDPFYASELLVGKWQGEINGCFPPKSSLLMRKYGGEIRIWFVYMVEHERYSW